MERFWKDRRTTYAGLFLAIITMAFAGNAYAYCTSQGSNTNYEWIDGVSIANGNNVSGSNGGYADFTTQVIGLSSGLNNVTLTPGFRSSSYGEYWKIWIDFNKDNAFTEDESVFNGVSNSIVSGSITVPDTATSGTTRMRVSMKYGGVPPVCGSFTYGEVEDYTVDLNTTDTTSPIVVSKSPNTSAIDVSADSVITINFSEDINPQSVSDSSVSLSHAGSYITGTVSVSGKSITFTPDQALDYSTLYTATIYSGVLDQSGNPLLQDTVWSFTTAIPDTTAPTVTQTGPQDGELDVDINFALSAMFSEAMDPATINSSSFIVNDGTNNIPGTVVLNGTGQLASFYPAQALDYLTTYTATIAGTAKDIAGNALQTDYSWSFTSREFQLNYCSSYASNTYYMWISDVKVGSLTNSSPSQPATGYSDYTGTVFDLSRSFPQSVVLTPGYSGYAYTTYWRVFIDWNKDGAFTSDETAFSGSGNVAVNGNITVPDYATAGNTRMRVSMQYAAYPGSCGSLSYGEVEDFRVNIPAAVADTVPPVVSSVSPQDSAQNVATNTTVAVNFSEAIDVSTLTNTSLSLTSDSASVDMVVSYNAQTNQAVFTPATNLEYNTFYTATLNASISDVSGNAMVNDHVWSFTTAVELSPSYIVKGTILNQGTGLADTALNITGDISLTVATDSSGNYGFESLLPGNYIITPSKAGYSFSPESIAITVIDASVSAVDFTASVLPSSLVNGDFEQGTFAGFNSFTTEFGVVNKGIVYSDVDNDGASSVAAQFVVGIDNAGNFGTEQGGGIYQTVGLSDGDLSVSMDIAASASSNNGDGGIVKIFLDGVLMASHDFGSITAGINEYATLSFDVANVAAGNHELRIQMTRKYLIANTSIYLDDIVLTGTSAQ